MDGCTGFNPTSHFRVLCSNVPNYFLSGCTSFNQVIDFSDSTSSIGDGFLANCTGYNSVINFPASLKKIGSYFLQNCSGYDTNVTLTNSITNIGGYFMNECVAMVHTVNLNALSASVLGANPSNFGTFNGTAACYTTGVKIIGTNAQQYLDMNPNVSPDEYGNMFYRNVIAG
jgi:hypothetical protein